MTTSSNGQLADVVEGLVESTNERGIKVGGEWRNVSKFHPIDLPDRGARVRIELESKGFIRTLQILDQAPLAGQTRRITIARSLAWRASKRRRRSAVTMPRSMRT